MKIIVDFGGGLDVCFENKKELTLEFEEQQIKMTDVITRLKTLCNPKKLDFFYTQQLRPGILVLINDADWELEDKEEAQLQHNDRVSFISTLHGG
ncbi:unnamed protein product [Paramecium primaurelia]|uniref:Ubiquitin-related modifier 1 homolog n=2 Tax=Paramecium TaxID=5884 RepID=A0A8S1VW93_PAROT|nr:unnamed protein product [Paramecium primaurelia]CAD8178556.1 unnamed protein product [Paramecium octaurelia]